MPIRLIVDNNGCLAMDAAVLVEAFEGALSELGLADRKSRAASAVATYIIAFAKAGECEPARLRDLAAEAIRQDWRRPQDAPLALKRLVGNRADANRSV